MVFSYLLFYLLICYQPTVFCLETSMCQVIIYLSNVCIRLEFVAAMDKCATSYGLSNEVHRFISKMT